MGKQLPKNWVETELGEITTKPQYGWTSKAGNIGEIKYLRTTDLSKGKVNWDTVPFCIDIPDDVSKYQVEKNDILISRAGSVGLSYRIEICPDKAVFASYLIRFKPLINAKLIEYYLQSSTYWIAISDVSAGIAVQNINAPKLSSLKFPLPPLAEQNRIVAKLDTLFAQLETIKASMAKIPVLLKEFRQQVLTQAVTGKLTEEWRKGKELENGLKSILENRNKYYENLSVENKQKGLKAPKKLDYSDFEMFELSSSFKLPEYWAKSNLKNIADLITDGEHATPKRTENGYYLLSARNVQNGYISLTNVDYVPKEEYDRIKNRCNPEHNDILISCSGTVGRVSVVPENLQFVMVRSAALIKFQSNTEISKFIEYTLRSDFGQSQINKLQKSTAQANLFLAPIGKIVVPIPSIKEQQEIVSRVESLFAKADAIEQQYQSLKEKIDTLPQALLHKAFKGELTKQLESDGDARELLQQIQELKGATGKKVKSKTTKKT